MCAASTCIWHCNWYGIVAPAGTAKSVVDRLYDEVRRAIAQADARERPAGVALDPALAMPDPFRELISGELARWAKVVKDAKVQAE